MNEHEVRTTLDALADTDIADPEKLRDLLEAVLVVGLGLELDQALQRIVEVACRVMGAQYCALGVRAPDQGLQEFLYTGISKAQRAKMGPLPVGEGVLGAVLEKPEILRIPHLSEHPSSVGFPPHHPPMDTFLGAPVIARGEVFGRIYLTEKLPDPGSDDPHPEFTEQDERLVAVLAVAAGIAVDNARHYEAARTRHRWMQILAHRGSAPLSGIALEDTLSGLCEDVAGLTDAVDCFIVTGTAHDCQVRGSTRGGIDVELLNEYVDCDEMRDQEFFVREVTADVPWLRDGARWLSVQTMQQTAGTFGAVVLTHRCRRYFEPEEESGMQGVARVASLAVAYAEQQQMARDFERLEDRHRIARDLHDHVIQRLFAIGMSLQTMQATPSEFDARIEQVISDMDRTIAQIRTSIFDLQSAGDTERPTLRRSVLDVVTELSSHAPIVPSVEFVGPVDTLAPDGLVPHITAVLREGLSNALRHSGGDRINVRIKADDCLEVTITDNGAGISPRAQFRGLHNLTRRAYDCDGNFTVDTKADGGTTLVWEVPLHA